MSSRIRNWAGAQPDSDDNYLSRIRRSPAPTTVPLSAPAQQPAPAQAPALLNASGMPVSNQPRQIYVAPSRAAAPAVGMPVTETCYIVKGGDNDTYRDLMSQVPDIGLQLFGDLSNGYDAMQAPGVPEGAPMAHWTPNSRYYTGTSDSRSQTPDLSQGVARYGESLGSIRASRAVRVVPVAPGRR